MNQDFTFKRRTIVAVVALLLLADVALAVFSWHMSSTINTPPQRLAEEMWKLKLQKADIENAEKIQGNFPNTERECDKFEQSLPSPASASSTISSELGDVSKKAGVQLTGITYHDREMNARNITEREMEATVSGEYTNVVKFLNGLQKSQNHYVVDSLELGPESNAPNLLRVNVHMRTFFRTSGA